MRLLLDTHAFIWYTTDSSRLTATGRSLIDNGENDILLSTASVWEMAIKHSIGKLTFSMPFMEFIKQQIAVNRIDILEITFDHIEVVASLPLHHRDQEFLDGTRHVIYPWNQSQIENRKSSSPRIYPWGQSKI